MYTYMYVYVCAYVCMHVCVYKYVQDCSSNLCAKKTLEEIEFVRDRCIHTHIDVHRHTHRYTHRHTHRHTNTHIAPMAKLESVILTSPTARFEPKFASTVSASAAKQLKTFIHTCVSETCHIIIHMSHHHIHCIQMPKQLKTFIHTCV